MIPRFKQVTIIGVGLIGGSLGMALCRRGLAKEVVGSDCRLENLCTAVEMGVIHRFAVSPAEGVAGADLVVIATPVNAIIPVLREILPYLSPGVIVTDVGSTKATIASQAEKLLPAGVSFVGGHPMAGSEQAGVKAADPNLFENAFYLITPTNVTTYSALKAVAEMAEGVGAKVMVMDPERHDFFVAAVSHLPHLLAATLVNTVARIPEKEKILSLAAGGFLDTTRVAASCPEMWRDIFMNNREQVLYMLRLFREELDIFENLIKEGKNGNLERNLRRAQEVRSALPVRTKGA